MSKQQEIHDQSPESPEMREMIEAITQALVKSGQDARRLAEMTGTPLVVKNTCTLQPANPTQLKKVEKENRDKL